MTNPRDPQAAEIAAAAARLTGTSAQLAKRLRALLDEGAPKPGPRESADARRDREAEAAAHERTVAALRHRLASDFAEARGWRVTPAPFAVKELARRSAGGNWHRPPREWLATMFHPAFYRDSARRAAAMVAHPLREVVDQGRADIEAWAAERELVAAFPDVASWQDPARMALVVFEPAEPEAAATPTLPAAAAAVDAASPTTAPDLDALRPEAVPDVAVPELAEVPVSQISTLPEASDQVGKIDTASPAPAASVMRPIVPLDLPGAVPADLSGQGAPDWDVVAPTDLLVDEAYQRGLGPRSLALVRRIVERWSWSKFKPPICTRVDGRLHVIDGQHTTIAAASHGGVPLIPVLVVAVPEVADRAEAFLSHSRDRLAATAVQIHRAGLTAGDDEAVALDGVCRAAGVELLPFPPSGTAPYLPRQTVAVVGIRRLIARRGAERAAEILGCLAAAEVAPISGDLIRLAETLLCDEQYAGGFDVETLAAALRGLTAKTQAEARELAIAQRLSAWRALAAVLYRNRGKNRARGTETGGATRRRASA